MKFRMNIASVIRISLLICFITSTVSCKKYLQVIPVDKLTGNNFFKTKEDVEANLASMYLTFFQKINESSVIGAIGEYRSGEVRMATSQPAGSFRRVVEVLGQNNLLAAIDPGAVWGSASYNFKAITYWVQYFRVIQSANILIENLNDGIEGLSSSETKRYISEATFIRCFTYFWMVRIYGDVPYYKNAYQAEPLGREKMVTVINNCIEDMMSHKDDMPWTYSDPAQKGARASRGSVMALLMNMNMWNAGFDKANKEHYYKQTEAIGNELVNSNTYHLIPLTEWATVIEGRSDESLFEFFRSINYGDNNNAFAPFGDHFLRYPYKFPAYPNRYSGAYFRTEYLRTLYPDDVTDRRKELWYEDMYATNGEFLMKKWAANVYAGGNEDKNPDNTFLIFRYSGSILLLAEALAELGKDFEAMDMVNIVRNRAEAQSYTGQGGQELKDFIFLERARELIGEGHRYFDLVRTGRIMNSQWAATPLTQDQFNRGGWTWPIDASALNNNPKMVLNQYWLTGGF